MTYRYKNTTDHELDLVGIGIVEAGKTIETEEVIENPNLEPVGDAKKKKVSKEDGDDN